MNNASKTVAAVAAAAVLGGGVVAIDEYLSEPEKTDGVKAESVVDDVQPVTVEVPRVAIPRVEIPRVAVPGVVTVRILSPLELEELGIPALLKPDDDLELLLRCDLEICARGSHDSRALLQKRCKRLALRIGESLII